MHLDLTQSVSLPQFTSNVWKMLPTGSSLEPAEKVAGCPEGIISPLPSQFKRSGKPRLVWMLCNCQQGLKGVTHSSFTLYFLPFLWQLNFFRRMHRGEQIQETEEKRRENISPVCSAALHPIQGQNAPSLSPVLLFSLKKVDSIKWLKGFPLFENDL